MLHAESTTDDPSELHKMAIIPMTDLAKKLLHLDERRGQAEPLTKLKRFCEMPELSRFHGIVIRMHWREHPPPHFHVKDEADFVG